MSSSKSYFFALGMSFLVIVLSLVYLMTSKSNEEGSARLVSLGTPKEINKPLKNEQKVILNDPIMEKNWGLMGTGGASDIRANRAWKITRGNRNIVVAVIDTGIDIKHPDLKNNLWKNPGEIGKDAQGRNKANNGIDDDKNGFIDDVHGWNFVSNNGNLEDNHGHGTHIAGIIGAEGGNGIGITGVSPKVSLMVLKYYDPKAKKNDNLLNTVKAIRYATQMGVNIINYSGGGLEYSSLEYSSIKEAHDKGILFVSAAGNEYSNSDNANSRYYPANYQLDNIISVTAINPSAQVLRSSNFGIKTVDIAAPGEGIFSTLPNNKYGVMTGTSQATAFVSGVAALIYSNNKHFEFKHVKRQILSTTNEAKGVTGKTKTSGILNSWAALAIQPMIPISGIIPSDRNQVFQNQIGSSDSITVGLPVFEDEVSSLSPLVKALKKTRTISNDKNQVPQAAVFPGFVDNKKINNKKTQTN